MAAKPDYWVQKVQEWYNSEYQGKTGYTKIVEDGIIGQGTCKALVHALQVELGVPTPNGTFGPTTIKYFNDSLGDNGIDENVTNKNIIQILQGGFLCKGISCFCFDGIWGDEVMAAIAQFRACTGISGWGIDARHMKALLNTDPFVLNNSGHSYVREMQQYLNHNYSDYFWQNIGLIPCNGIPERNMSKAIIYALQLEEAKSANPSNPNVSGVDGIVGTNTLNKAPILSQASDKKEFVKILQMALACMHLKNVGLDGVFDISVKDAVEDFQKFMCLHQNSSVTLGTVERKTWASLLLSKGDVSRYAGACDCSTILDLGKAQGIKAAGYKYVGRYLTGTVRKNGVSVSKALTLDEIAAITTAELRIFAIYQDGGASSTYFNYSKGYEDAKKAYEAAKNLRIPLGEIIYFAVDYDFTDNQTTTSIIPHFRGINEYFNEHGIRYRIGIYASRNICTRVSEEKLACSSFVADMSTGYSGNMGFRMPENWAFDQIQELKNFVKTPYFTEAFDLDRDVASGRYIGFDGTMLCGRENYKDVTQHDMEYTKDGKLRCKVCGYEVLTPEAQDKAVLSEPDLILVNGLTAAMVQVCLNENNKTLFQYPLWSMAYDVREKEEYRGKYECQNADGVCFRCEYDLGLSLTAYNQVIDPLKKVNEYNYIKYSPFMNAVVDVLYGFAFSSITGSDYVALLDLLDAGTEEGLTLSLNSILQMIMTKLGAKEFADLMGFVGFAVEVSESSKKQTIEIGDYIIIPSIGIQYQMTIVLNKDGELKFTIMPYE